MGSEAVTGLSLFSGAGIGELVFKHIFPDYRTIGYVEWDKYCQQVIRQRIKDGWLDDAPIFGDIRQFNERYASLYAGRVDWLSGGFPCQPFSVAGRQLGEADERNMWPATRDAIRILRPRYCFLENGPGLSTNGYVYRAIADLAEIGYVGSWDHLSARSVGAPHKRDRWWCLASDPVCVRQQGQGEYKTPGNTTAYAFGEADRLVDAFRQSSLPFVCRGHDGLAEELEQRVKCLGNGWVPQVAANIIKVDTTFLPKE